MGGRGGGIKLFALYENTRGIVCVLRNLHESCILFVPDFISKMTVLIANIVAYYFANCGSDSIIYCIRRYLFNLPRAGIAQWRHAGLQANRSSD